MRIAYLDCFSGVSGDMLLGAFVACGLPLSALQEGIPALGLEWRQERVRRKSLVATQIRIEAPATVFPRAYRDIIALLHGAALPEQVRRQSLAVFGRLAEAEAALHGCAPEQVHFHELGACDTIADIVGCCIALQRLGIEELHCSALNLGSGTVQTEHGLLPVPAPATAALLKGVPVYSSGIPHELVTPTGAALVATLAKSFGPIPPLQIEAVGYGAGSKDISAVANVLRVILGETTGAESSLERLVMLEANVDDMNPQLCGFFAERAFSLGALDVFFSPVQMKKNRPGVLLSVLCRPEQRDAVTELFFEETTTLGVRGHEVFRRALEREWMPVATPYGEVRVKVSRQDGHIQNFSPEFEDCRRLAAESDVPLKKVLQEATFAFWRKHLSNH
ncbi:MAG: TIGR00299 family protein [Acidobacteria bacterium RIFCSPLOWO2_02_FULL_59_13]|nr:MAG: TIGR00299 family protein [Acidobacteria bacterium RIFCSPLOWO2_02_FULL_59_13]